MAERAFRGELKKAFSQHQSTEKRGVLTVGGWQFDLFGFFPDIDSSSRFSKFLQGIQAAEPDMIGNTVVAKVIHDTLNAYPGGLPVENNMGDQWKLRGDGTLDKPTLARVRKAVARSVYNVVVEAPRDTLIGALQEYVWNYVPRPTNASKKVIANLVRTYTDPGGEKLIDATAELIGKKYPILLEVAKKRGKLEKI